MKLTDRQEILLFQLYNEGGEFIDGLDGRTVNSLFSRGWIYDAHYANGTMIYITDKGIDLLNNLYNQTNRA